MAGMAGNWASPEERGRLVQRLESQDPNKTDDQMVRWYHKIKQDTPGQSSSSSSSEPQRDPKEFVDEYVEEKVAPAATGDSTRYSAYRKY